MNIGRRGRIVLAAGLILALLLSYCWLGGKGYVPLLLTPQSTSLSSTATTATATTIPASTFVERSGSSLVLNGKPFRFSGANVYWLGLLQGSDGAVIYPSHFMVDDALATASLMGATVVRSHTLGISVGCQRCIEPSLGQFNPTAFQAIDYALQSARQHHLRLIIPLVDNWHYYPGGKHTFTDWRGISDESAFYDNAVVVRDFQQYVSTLLNHVNSYTGIAYKNDPTILAWETGNELDAPFPWVQTMASYIKSIDDHHLVMDGNYGETEGASVFWQDLKISAVDLYTGHYYPPSIDSLRLQSHQVHEADKVFIVGEYDWNTTDGDALSDFLAVVLKSDVAGDLYWSLFPHNDQYGYVAENEHYTLYYPGSTPDVRQRIQMLVTHAYAMQGQSVPTQTPPDTPSITSINDHAIAWRGAAGAASYSVERSTEGKNGPWSVVCDRCATDYTTPWMDETQRYQVVWYRIRGYSVFGIPGPYSNAVAS